MCEYCPSLMRGMVYGLCNIQITPQMLGNGLASTLGRAIVVYGRTPSMVALFSMGMDIGAGPLKAHLFNRLPAHHSGSGRKHRTKIPRHHTTSTMALFLTRLMMICLLERDGSHHISKMVLEDGLWPSSRIGGLLASIPSLS